MSQNKIIDVIDLEKKYNKGNIAINKISFSVDKGEFFALLGPNGAGKTTTMSIMTTNLNKTSGKVYINNLDLDVDENSIRKNIGVIFQKPSLDDSLSAEENIRLHTVVYGMYKFAPSYSLMSAEYKKRLSDLVDVLGMGKSINRTVGDMSGGMKRRFEIIRGLMHKPNILFLDEPSTGIDPQSRRDLWSYLKEIQKSSQLTVFYTTHYMEEAENANKICIMLNGNIVKQGTPSSIRQNLLEETLIISTNYPDQLIAELDALQVSYSQTKPGFFVIDIKNRDPHAMLKSINTETTFIDIERPTLEDAYVYITNSKNE